MKTKWKILGISDFLKTSPYNSKLLKTLNIYTIVLNLSI
jgi:hypothetical protein